MAEYCPPSIPEFVANLAVRAAVLEAAATLKPGLVCMDDAGIHTDMDITTLTASAFSLQPYFRQAVELGLDSQDEAPPDVFVQLRGLGQHAEAVMYEATGGVNTHKGLIFSQGLLCAAAGRLLARREPLCIHELCTEAGELARDAVERDLRALFQEAEVRVHTAGEALFVRHGFSGIRGEAGQGFPHVERGATVLRHWLERGNPNKALVNTLLALMAEVEDTNILSRGGLEKFTAVRRMARQALERGGAFSPAGLAALNGLRQYCRRERLSPGGCADLLALSIFCHLLDLEYARKWRSYD